MEQLQLDAATAGQYQLFFSLADEDRDGLVGLQDALSFFSKSGLAKDALAQIWAQARIVTEKFGQVCSPGAHSVVNPTFIIIINQYNVVLRWISAVLSL